MKEILAATALTLVAFYSGYAMALINVRMTARAIAREELQDRLQGPRP